MTTVRDCDYPWTGFMIWSNGTVSCCCYGSSAVGDLSSGPPESVWNSPTLQSLRASLSSGVVHSVCASGTCKYVVGSRASQKAAEEPPARPAGFDEEWYVAHYFDVRAGVASGRWGSGLDHYRQHGHREFRSTNAAEWRHSVRDQWKQTIRIGSGYGARLNWLEPARVQDNAIVMTVSAMNSGSIAWQPKGAGPTPLQVSTGAYRQLDDFGRSAPMAEHRAELPHVVRPGDSIRLDLHACVDDLPVGKSFLLVDLVCDERAVRLSAAATPLVLGIYRDERTDEVDVIAG